MDPLVCRLASLDWPAEVFRPAFEEDYEPIVVTPETVARLAADYNIAVNADPGTRNVILLSRPFLRSPGKLHIRFAGSDNVLLFESYSGVTGAINCMRDAIGVFMGGESQRPVALSVNLYIGGELFWGRESRTFGCTILVSGERRVTVGDDCLFSGHISLRTGDHHSIIDLHDYKQKNIPGDVTIGRHVWVGPHVNILRNVRVGRGSIIGLGSIVTKSVGEAELWAGVPARRLQRHVSWVGSHPARENEVAALREFFDDAAMTV